MSAFVKRDVVFDTDGNPIGAECTLGDGRKVRVLIEELSPAMQAWAMAHGIKQKLGDGTSGFSKEGDFNGAFDEMSAIRESIVGNDWNRKATGLGGIWVEALARASNMDLEAARERWGKLSYDDQKKVRKHPRVKKAKLDIEAERLAKRDDREEDLDDLIG